jgi:carbon storage regulator
MLVLTRRPDEEIVIGDTVRLKVIAVRGQRVQLGIDAPREISIHRAEQLDRRDDCEPPPFPGEPRGNSLHADLVGCR